MIRNGRVDYDVEFKLCDYDQMVGLFKAFFSEGSDEEAQEFANKFEEFKHSPAELQEHFIKYKNDMKGLLESLK